MSIDYTGMASTIAAMFAANGRTVTVLRETGGSFNPVTGVRTPPAVESHQASAVITSFSPREVDGELIRQDDLQAMIAANALPITPEVRDDLIDGSRRYAVTRIEEIRPGPTALYYRLYLRG